jgi:thiol-disulfide isomerase/thioredoxin
MSDKKTVPIFVICGFLLFSTAICTAMPAKQKEPDKPGTLPKAPEPVTLSSRTETDPYTDSRAGKGLPDKVELFFFYEQDCELCNELDKFYEIVSQKLPREIRGTYPHMIYTINILGMESRKTYEQVTDAMGLDRILLSAPLLIAGGRIFQGHETIFNNIEEAFLTAGEDIFVNKRFYNPALRKTGEQLFADYSLKQGHVTVVYFYRLVCPDCKQISPIINDLPKTVRIDGEEFPLDIIKINTRSGNNNERVIAFFDKYQVPDADRQVPIVFLADSYLSGTDPILEELTQKLGIPYSENKLTELIR